MNEKLAELILLLTNKRLTISSMESLTGGLFASSLTAIPNASKTFKGALVTYTNEIKILSGVKKETIDKYGAISFECIKEMAVSAKNYFKSDIAVSFSGNAGPLSSEGKEVGLVFIGIVYQNNISSYKVQFSGERNEIRNQCVDFAVEKILEILKK